MDLLPDRPTKAVETITNYIDAHRQFLPEELIDGMEDAKDIVEARYCDRAHPRQVLGNLNLTEFGCLVAELYEKMGFEIALNKASDKGDVLIIASRDNPGDKQVIGVFCNNRRTSVGVDIFQRASDKIDELKATKGVIATSSGFSKKVRERVVSRNNIELFDNEALAKLLNENLGSNWPEKTIYLLRKWTRGGCRF
ncbi:restriction endonuclease [Puia sp. P3]|uniref:restriction endonuclease n=1 Tax=Puia sp. P3 TaxID=3423952 RepID=UPI003D675E47